MSPESECGRCGQLGADAGCCNSMAGGDGVQIRQSTALEMPKIRSNGGANERNQGIGGSASAVPVCRCPGKGHRRAVGRAIGRRPRFRRGFCKRLLSPDGVTRGRFKKLRFARSREFDNIPRNCSVLNSFVSNTKQITSESNGGAPFEAALNINRVCLAISMCLTDH